MNWGIVCDRDFLVMVEPSSTKVAVGKASKWKECCNWCQEGSSLALKIIGSLFSFPCQFVNSIRNITPNLLEFVDTGDGPIS